MEFKHVATIKDIKQGDLLLIRGDFASGDKIQLHRVVKVKETTIDGTEIILSLKGNVYFNLGMHLTGKSWAREVIIVNS